MSETRYWTQLATEQFSPSDLVRQATAAEAAGFDVEQMGASVVCLQNGSGSDPLGALSVYGESVLPAVRGAAVG